MAIGFDENDNFFVIIIGGEGGVPTHITQFSIDDPFVDVLVSDSSDPK